MKIAPTWKGRSLANYIAQHREKHPEIVKARTLTEARKIRRGEKIPGRL